MLLGKCVLVDGPSGRHEIAVVHARIHVLGRRVAPVAVVPRHLVCGTGVHPDALVHREPVAHAKVVALARAKALLVALNPVLLEQPRTLLAPKAGRALHVLQPRQAAQTHRQLRQRRRRRIHRLRRLLLSSSAVHVLQLNCITARSTGASTVTLTVVIVTIAVVAAVCVLCHDCAALVVKNMRCDHCIVSIVVVSVNRFQLKGHSHSRQVRYRAVAAAETLCLHLAELRWVQHSKGRNLGNLLLAPIAALARPFQLLARMWQCLWERAKRTPGREDRPGTRHCRVIKKRVPPVTHSPP